MSVFDKALEKALPDASLPKRLENIVDMLTYDVYSFTTLGNEPFPNSVHFICRFV